MVNVILLSNELNKGEFIFEAIEFPEAPLLGDDIDISEFEHSNGTKSVKNYMESIGLTHYGEVESRTWRMFEGTLHLFISLSFPKKEM